MRVTWTIAGSGAGAADVDTVEEAVTALQGVLRDVAARMAPDVAARLLRDHWGPLRASMSTDGWSAVNAGETWTRSTGAISAELSPGRE